MILQENNGTQEVLGSVLQEKYFGKSAKLVEAEALLQEVCDSVKRNVVTASHPDNIARIEKVEKLLQDQFNVVRVDIIVSNLALPQTVIHKITDKIWQSEYEERSKTMDRVSASASAYFKANRAYQLMNLKNSPAFTVPFPQLDSHFLAEAVEHGADSYRFKHPKHYVQINVNLKIFDKLNGGEVLSIILHEMGHNFYLATFVNRFLKMFSSIVMIFTTLILFLANIASENVVKFLHKIGIGKFLVEFYDFALRVLYETGSLWQHYETTIGIFKKMKYIYNNFENFLTGNVFGSVKSFLFNGIVMGKYNEEEFADDFATVHGYGPEISSAFHKFDIDPRMQNDAMSSFYSSARTIAKTIVFVEGKIADVHPQARARMRNVIQCLEEQKRMAKPKSKALIQKDIDQAKKILASYEKAGKDWKVFDLSLLDKLKKAVSDAVYSNQIQLLDKQQEKKESK